MLHSCSGHFSHELLSVGDDIAQRLKHFIHGRVRASLMAWRVPSGSANSSLDCTTVYDVSIHPSSLSPSFRVRLAFHCSTYWWLSQAFLSPFPFFFITRVAPNKFLVLLILSFYLLLDGPGPTRGIIYMCDLRDLNLKDRKL